MKPGDELDEKIADIVYPTWRDDFGKPDWNDLPNYSTNIGDAWVAFEWLEKKFPMRIILGGFNQRVLTILETPERFGKNDITYFGETYAHAICLAILASREVNGL